MNQINFPSRVCREKKRNRERGVWPSLNTRRITVFDTSMQKKIIVYFILKYEDMRFIDVFIDVYRFMDDL